MTFTMVPHRGDPRRWSFYVRWNDGRQSKLAYFLDVLADTPLDALGLAAGIWSDYLKRGFDLGRDFGIVYATDHPNQRPRFGFV